MPFRTTRDLHLICELDESDVVGLYTNNIRQVYKIDSNGEIKNHKLWFLKCLDDEITAKKEVVAQEFFRLILPRHPKTRIIKRSNHTYSALLSEEIPNGHTSLDSLSDRELRTKFHAEHFSGLGELLIVSLLVNEVDFKEANVFFNANNELVKLDGDCCFYDHENSPIHFPVLETLPFLKNYWARNWIGVRTNDEEDENSLFQQSVCHNLKLKEEMNQTILKIILLPDELLKRFEKNCFPNQCELPRLADVLINRKAQLKEVAMNNRLFRKYLLTQKAYEIQETFVQELHAFRSKGKQGLGMRIFDKMIREEFANLLQQVKQEIRSTRNPHYGFFNSYPHYQPQTKQLEPEGILQTMVRFLGF